MKIFDEVFQFDLERDEACAPLRRCNVLLLAYRCKDDGGGLALLHEELEQGLVLKNDPVSSPPEHLD